MRELIENSAPPESHVGPCDYDVLIADTAYLDTLGKAMLVTREDMRQTRDTLYGMTLMKKNFIDQTKGFVQAVAAEARNLRSRAERIRGRKLIRKGM
jgi:hypothetical protein